MASEYKLPYTAKEINEKLNKIDTHSEKLLELEEEINNKPTDTYVHPESHPASMITGLSTVATSGSYNDLSDKPESHSLATSEEAGLMSAEDKTMLYELYYKFMYEGTDGLAYTLKSDGTYECTGIGTATDTDIMIASYYEGIKVTSIGQSAFKSNTSITSIIIPYGVTSIKATAFYNCTSLTSVTIPGTVKSILTQAFGNCKLLTNLIIGNGVNSIGGNAFYNCTSLTSVNIPDSVTSIGERAFSWCSSLTSVTIGAGVINLSAGSYEPTTPFFMCSALKIINVSEKNTEYAAVDGILFNKDKTKLVIVPAGTEGTTFTVPEGVTSIGVYAFSCCTFTNIILPYGVTNIETYAFDNCHNCKVVTLPNSVTSIGTRAFYNCYNVTSIIIPVSVTSIGESVFHSSLKNIYYTGTEEQWNAITIGDDNTPLTSATITYNYTEA